MNRHFYLLVLLLLAFAVGCTSGPRPGYQQDVYPILEDNCFACHTPPQGAGYVKTGLNLESYETLMHGTLYGPVVIPENSRQSILNMLVEGRADASMRMPHNRGQPLTTRENEILRLWVDQGASNN